MAEAPEPSTSPPAGRVHRVDGARLEEAVRVLVRGDAAAASRFLAHARSNRISLDHLWAFLDDRDRIRATVLVAPGTGRTAMVFASRAGSTAMIDVLGDLVRRAIDGLDGAGIDLAQALSEGSLSGRDHPGAARASGHLGFCGHGDVVHFKDLRVQPISGTPSPSAR